MNPTDGSTHLIGSGLASPNLVNGRNSATFDLRPIAVQAGSRLRIRMAWYFGHTSSGARMLFGGAQYGDAGIALTTGHIQ